MPTPDWTALRGEFPTLDRWTYLDVARKAIPPRCQEQAVSDYYKDVYTEAGADAWSATNVAHARGELAQLLGAQPAEIAFTKNTTEGLLIAAHALTLDRILVTDDRAFARVPGLRIENWLA